MPIIETFNQLLSEDNGFICKTRTIQYVQPGWRLWKHLLKQIKNPTIGKKIYFGFFLRALHSNPNLITSELLIVPKINILLSSTYAIKSPKHSNAQRSWFPNEFEYSYFWSQNKTNKDGNSIECRFSYKAHPFLSGEFPTLLVTWRLTIKSCWLIRSCVALLVHLRWSEVMRPSLQSSRENEMK